MSRRGDLVEVIAIMALRDHAEIERRVRRADLATRSDMALCADLALLLPMPIDHERQAIQMVALTATLATPLVIDLTEAKHLADYVDVAGRDRRHRLLHWLLLGLCCRIPADPPPVHHADLPWLTQVVAANAAQPWIPRLLAAMAAAA